VGSVLKFEDVTFGYGRTALFRSFDLEIGAGEMTAVLGPNGSGKTTLVRLAAGGLAPSAGLVELDGRSVAGLPARERAKVVAVVPQDTHLAFAFTVREVVLMGRAPHQGPLGIDSEEDRTAAREAMEQTGIDGLADRPFHALSGGERQRVVVARALAQRPRLLLLDEPTAFLDLRHRLAVYDLVGRLNREDGLTVVVVSHDLNLAARYCRRVVLLHRGAVAADGETSAVLTRENLRAVYRVDADVRTDPGSGKPYVVPVRPA
jgi:iron complex transport system ATP-binding protein